MPEVADTGKDHRHTELIRRCDYVGIAHRSARLNHSGRASPSCFLDSIREREESIRSNDAARE